MPTTTLTLPGTATSLTPSVGYPWANVNNIKAVGGGSASCTFDTNDVASDYLLASNFGFSIPADATISGISVEFSGSDDFIFDGDPLGQGVNFYLWNGSSTIGVYRFDFLDGTAKTVGSASDKWQTTAGTLTPTLVNNSIFGVACNIYTGLFDVYPCSALIDYVKMSVTYSLGGGLVLNQCGYGGAAWWLKRYW
jgi:hypothetical protein